MLQTDLIENNDRICAYANDDQTLRLLKVNALLISTPHRLVRVSTTKCFWAFFVNAKFFSSDTFWRATMAGHSEGRGLARLTCGFCGTSDIRLHEQERVHDRKVTSEIIRIAAWKASRIQLMILPRRRGEFSWKQMHFMVLTVCDNSTMEINPDIKGVLLTIVYPS
jgi:hypothetical protein